MIWKGCDFETRAMTGEYPDEMTMSLAVRQTYPAGTRLAVENDDGGQYEGIVDNDAVKITPRPTLAEIGSRATRRRELFLCDGNSDVRARHAGWPVRRFSSLFLFSFASFPLFLSFLPRRNYQN